MKTIRTLLIAAFATLCLQGFSQSDLMLKGKVILPEGNAKEVKLLALVNGTESHEIELGRNGHFHIVLYENDNYVFTFSKDGYIDKTVFIDTTVPNDLYLIQTIEFDIAMENYDGIEEERVSAIYNYSKKDEMMTFSIPAETNLNEETVQK